VAKAFGKLRPGGDPAVVRADALAVLAAMDADRSGAIEVGLARARAQRAAGARRTRSGSAAGDAPRAGGGEQVEEFVAAAELFLDAAPGAASAPAGARAAGGLGSLFGGLFGGVGSAAGGGAPAAAQQVRPALAPAGSRVRQGAQPRAASPVPRPREDSSSAGRPRARGMR
jgi:hypothetical protein